MKRTIYQTAGLLGLLAGLLCLLFAVLSFLGHVPDLFASPLLILGAARMTRSGGQRATTGGIYLLIFGCVAYLVGGAIGATLTLLTGVLAVMARYL
jgi:hypothetical protein